MSNTPKSKVNLTFIIVCITTCLIELGGYFLCPLLPQFTTSLVFIDYYSVAIREMLLLLFVCIFIVITGLKTQKNKEDKLKFILCMPSLWYALGFLTNGVYYSIIVLTKGIIL